MNRIKRGIILCGGHGTRLYPLTKCINKHLLPIGEKPMAQWNIEKMVNAGITEILIISGVEHCGSIIQQFGDGSELGCNLTYKVQAKAGGIAEAILLAEDWSKNEPIIIALGDNISNFNLEKYINEFDSDYNGAYIFLKEVNDPERFGVAETYQKMSEYSNRFNILSLEEKPKQPKSNLAVIGYYIYDSTVFERIKSLEYSARGELEVTDLNKSYLNDCKLLGFKLDKEEFWTDAGTFESYHKAQKLVNENRVNES
jgi:glucose-1-phosphate thymidylyltransferase